MERLNPHTCSTFWKVSGMMLLFIAGTSYLSNRCHENNSMSRKHILKFTELLRSAMEHSIKATQDTNSVTKYRDVCVAKVSKNKNKLQNVYQNINHNWVYLFDIPYKKEP